MSAEYPLPVRYVLYTHYPEGNDLKEYLREYELRQAPPPVDKFDGVRFLVKHLSGLRGLLTWPGYEGMLVIFYSPGLNECLAGIANHTSLSVLRSCKSLEFAKSVHDYVEGVMNEHYKELLPRLRVFTALDLYRVFGRIRHSTIADRLTTWMVGDATGTYDSPKIIEAIVRLRLLGSGVPVFRVDFDVLLRGEENSSKKNLEFSSTIGSCLTAYQLRRDSPNLASFIFSASYDHKILNEPEAADDFHKWGRAYATRVFPALPFNESLIKQTVQTINDRYEKMKKAQSDEPLTKKEGKIRAEEWDKYAATTFSASLARKFFGFDSANFKTSQVGGIAAIGAHPIASVISGAMLYLSDGAILDLPPFSNFRQNVSWVDDHLKYCLHRELQHLRRPAFVAVTEWKRSDLLTYSKLDDVVVQKAGRIIEKDLRKYILDEYLPTLLRGTILDAWITPDPLLKYRPEELTEENRTARSQLRNQQQSGGLLPSALQLALATCKFPNHIRHPLERELEATALKRITQVRRQWGRLTENGMETFASIWAKGQVYSYCEGCDLRYVGIVNDPSLPLDIELAARHLSHDVRQDLNQLIDDACDYIDWTRDWPTIVQVIRSIEQGTLRTDLNYDVERARIFDPT